MGIAIVVPSWSLLDCWILQKAITTWHPASKYDIHRQMHAYVPTVPCIRNNEHPKVHHISHSTSEKRETEREKRLCKIQYKSVVKFVVEIFLRLRIHGGAAKRGSICHRISACCAPNSIIIVNYIPKKGHASQWVWGVSGMRLSRTSFATHVLCVYFLSRHFLTQTDKNVRKFIWHGVVCSGCWQSIWSSANGWNNDALAIFEMMAIHVRAQHTNTRPCSK